MIRSDVPEEHRAGLHKRFPHIPLWAPAPAPPTTPWELIRAVLAQGHADGLDDLQLAGGVYSVLVSHSVISEGRA